MSKMVVNTCSEKDSHSHMFLYHLQNVQRNYFQWLKILLTELISSFSKTYKGRRYVFLNFHHPFKVIRFLFTMWINRKKMFFTDDDKCKGYGYVMYSLM